MWIYSVHSIILLKDNTILVASYSFYCDTMNRKRLLKVLEVRGWKTLLICAFTWYRQQISQKIPFRRFDVGLGFQIV